MEALRRGHGWRGEGSLRERSEEREGATAAAKVAAADAARRLCRSYTTCCILVPAFNEKMYLHVASLTARLPVIASWCCPSATTSASACRRSSANLSLSPPLAKRARTSNCLAPCNKPDKSFKGCEAQEAAQQASGGTCGVSQVALERRPGGVEARPNVVISCHE